jgi:hypothetical protein
MNCAQCSKPFTCGCQKHTTATGVVIHKTCINSFNNIQGTPTITKPNNLNLELVQQQIKNLRNK